MSFEERQVRFLRESTLVFCCSIESPDLLLAGIRAGAQEFIPMPVTAVKVGEALSRLIQSHAEMTPAPEGRILSVISARGGAGATSVSINLAFGLSKLPETRVTLVDLGRPMGGYGWLPGNIIAIHSNGCSGRHPTTGSSLT